MSLPANQIAIIVILIILFTIIIVVLYYVFILNRSFRNIGKHCTTNQECGLDLYCGGPGICVVGFSGGEIGDTCSLNIDCEFGLICDNGTCRSSALIPLDTPTSNNTLSTPLPSLTSLTSLPSLTSGTVFTPLTSTTSLTLGTAFTPLTPITPLTPLTPLTPAVPITTSFSDMKMVVYVDGRKYYLHIDSSGSRWVRKSNQTFNYDVVNRVLSVNDGCEEGSMSLIRIGTNGNLVMSSTSSPIIIASVGQMHYIMKDQYNNDLSVNIANRRQTTFFSDPARYPNSPPPSSSNSTVLFNLKHIRY